MPATLSNQVTKDLLCGAPEIANESRYGSTNQIKAKRITTFWINRAERYIDTLTPNQPVKDAGQDRWTITKIDADGTIGWVLTADLKPVDATVRPKLDELFFVQDCIVVERSMNDGPGPAPWFVAADFLIARAIIETNLTNAMPKTAGSDAVGPCKPITEIEGVRRWGIARDPFPAVRS